MGGWRTSVERRELDTRQIERARLAEAWRSERESIHRRERLLAQRPFALGELARAQHSVKTFDNYLELVLTMHKDAWSKWNWSAVLGSKPPPRVTELEFDALTSLVAYRQPRFSQIPDAIVDMRPCKSPIPDDDHEDDADHLLKVAEWEWFKHVARGVIEGDIEAYAAALDCLSPFAEFEMLGSFVQIETRASWYLEALVTVRDPEIIPREEVSMSGKGRLQSRPMPLHHYWALYQEHLCSAALRVARELLAILPIRTAFVNMAKSGVAGPADRDLHTVVSVAFERDRLEALPFETLHPVEAVMSFRHEMKFHPRRGLSPVAMVSEVPAPLGQSRAESHHSTPPASVH
jgi:hypothetical protein